MRHRLLRVLIHNRRLINTHLADVKPVLLEVEAEREVFVCVRCEIGREGRGRAPRVKERRRGEVQCGEVEGKGVSSNHLLGVKRSHALVIWLLWTSGTRK